jgi:hypothetical protein
MNWEPIFNSLKDFFGNDPTMMLLLTVAFFFLKTLWPQPQPASQQILTGYLARIRDALRLGNRDGAELLAQEAIGKATAAVEQEVQPLVSSPLTIITSLLGNKTLMPLLLVGAVFLFLMLGQGGCQPKTSQLPAPVIQPTSLESMTDADDVPIRFLDGRADAGRDADFAFVSVESEPWAWTKSNGTAEQLGDFGDRGQSNTYTPASHTPDGSAAANVDARECGAGVCRGSAGRVVYWRAQSADRPVGALVRGQPLRNIARIAARPFRWVRIPGRPIARLFGRR